MATLPPDTRAVGTGDPANDMDQVVDCLAAITGAAAGGGAVTAAGTLSNLVSATSGGGTANFLRADGTWAAPTGGVTLDSTASDFQPDGVATAGSGASAARGDHAHPEKSYQWLSVAPSGALGETYPLMLSVGAEAFSLSGNAYATAIPLPKGVVVSNISMICTGSETLGTHGWFALTDSGFVVRAVSADQTGATFFTASNTPITLAMQSPYTTPSAGLYYCVFCVTTSGTKPTFTGKSVDGTSNTVGKYAATFGTPGGNPPSTGTTLGGQSTSNIQYYAYVS